MREYKKKYEVTFLILNYKTYKDTIVLAEELRRFKDFGVKYGLVVVDNASPNESWEKLNLTLGQCEDVYLVKNDVNGGYARGNNVGLRYMEGCPPKFVCIINNDVHFSESTIRALCQTYEFLPDPGILSPKQKLPNGEYLKFDNRLPSFIMDVNSLLPRPLIKPKYTEYVSNTEHLNLMKVDIIPGAFVFTMYELMRSMNYYDERTFLFCEERIITHKIHQLNLNNYILLDRSYLHQHSLTINKEASVLRQRKYLFDGKIIYTRYYRSQANIKVFVLDVLYYLFTPYILFRMWLLKHAKKLLNKK